MSDDDGHDFGNLFGSGDEASDLEGDQSLSPSPGPRSASPENNAFESEAEQSDEPERRPSKRPATSSHFDSDNDDSGRVDYFNDEEQDYGSDQEFGTAKKQRIEIDVQMPSLPLPVSSDGKFYLAKVPRFLDIETDEFDIDQIRAQNEPLLGRGQDQRVLQTMEHNIRWRKGVDDYGDETVESNAHFVEWEDGTMSLVVGTQIFDAPKKSLSSDEHTYLLAHQTTSGVLESHLEVTDQMTFRPYDIHSDTHRNLSGSVAEQVKRSKTKMFFTEKDPESLKHDLETEERERLQAQKKLESQRRRADDRYTSHRSTDNYEYDYIVDDDEEEEEEEEEQEYSSGEEEERERRLNRLKRTTDF
ncbi:Leo1-like protein-domain-containing protein [Fennellomyces sp. T-0311]|nr:Leo1-like protein-domain-containing protein [Fennellomyces sp. T-0311]